jgi:hypothetical protein
VLLPAPERPVNQRVKPFWDMCGWVRLRWVERTRA